MNLQVFTVKMSLPPLDELQWKSPEWIQSFGLRTDNVLEYFSQSPFFDKTSNNQVVKMQQQFSQMQQQTSGLTNITTATPHRQHILSTYPMHGILEQELSKLKGIEYVLEHVREPDFWIIRKRNRTSPSSVESLQDYYIIGANVYQSPTVAKIVQSRLLSTNFHLSKALKSLQQMCEFQPSQGVAFINTVQTASVSTITTGNSVVPTSSSSLTVGIATATRLPETGGENVASTAAMDSSGTNSGYSDIITQEMMDKLMITSMKSKPVYI